MSDDNNQEPNNETRPLLQENRNSTNVFLSRIQTLPWYKRPSPYMLLPMFILYELSATMLKIIQSNVLLALACKTAYNQDLSYDDPQCKSSDVQEMVSSYSSICSLVTGLVAVWVLPRIDGYSERHGRRFSFAYFMAFNMAAPAMVILCMHWWKVFGFYWVIISFFFVGMSGTDLLLWATISSYVADCVGPRDRTRIMSYMTAVEMAGNVFGPLMSSGLIRKSSTVLLPYYLAVPGIGLALLFVLFVLPESRSHRRRTRSKKAHEQRERQSWGKWAFKTVHVAQPVQTMWNLARQEGPHLKYTILALSAVELLYLCATEFKGTPEFLYFQMQFDWSAVDLGYFQAMVSVVRVVFSGAVIPALLTWIPQMLHKHIDEHPGVSKNELNLARVGLLAEVVGCLMFAYAKTGNFNYFAGVVESVGVMTRPILQSAFMNILSKENLNSYLHAKGALTVICAILVASAGMSIYSSLVKTYPVMIFIITAAIYLAGMLLSPLVKTNIGPESEDSSDEEDN